MRIVSLISVGRIPYPPVAMSFALLLCPRAPSTASRSPSLPEGAGQIAVGGRNESAPTENSKAMGIFSPKHSHHFAVRRNITPKAYHFPLTAEFTHQRGGKAISCKRLLPGKRWPLCLCRKVATAQIFLRFGLDKHITLCYNRWADRQCCYGSVGRARPW